jgi:uncharacterized protein YndB with AHSA1/START domain
MSDTVHDSFTLQRTYRASAERVFAAWADPQSKRRWFAEGEGARTFELDFRVGGRESSAFFVEIPGRGRSEIRNDTVFLDVVPARRIVFAYTMSTGGRPFSASLATIELEGEPGGQGTRLVFTEQSAFFEGADGRALREAGWRALLDALGSELDDGRAGDGARREPSKEH